MPLRTPFYDFHIQAGAKMVEYAGWEMPLLYKGIIQEHIHTRTDASLFDISHMGRLRFSGKDAQALLDKTVTRRLADQQIGVSRYSLVCNEAGGILDDVIVSRDKSDWLVVCNAANRLKLLPHFQSVANAAGMEVTIDDQTERTAMLALQGPVAIDRLADVLPFDLRAMKRYTFETASVVFIPLTVFRSGYTGEDGIEIILPAKAAGMAMKMMGGKLNRAGATLQPAGLGARDTLRLEAAMPLYGHELTESLDPLAANLGWAVDLTKDFLGASALRQIAAGGIPRKLTGLELEGRRTARQGAAVLHDGKTVGQITSGAFSPTQQRSIAMAYVDAVQSAEGTPLTVDVSGTPIPAKVVKLPFYKRTSAN